MKKICRNLLLASVVACIALALHTAQAEEQDNNAEQALKDAIMPRCRSLHEAAQKGDVEDMQRILKLGVNINASHGDGIKVRNWSAITANLAAQTGPPAVAQLWAAQRAEVGAMALAGDRPIHRAAYGNQPDAAVFLLENGADIDAKNERGWTALHWAALCGNTRVLKTLLAAGADPNARDQDDATPLHMAAEVGCLEAAKALVLFNADVNADDKYGITPLHWASFDGQSKLVSFLIAHGAKVNARDKSGRTPKRWAAINLLRMRGKGNVPNKLMLHGGVE